MLSKISTRMGGKQKEEQNALPANALPANYKVVLDVFEGPLDVLIHLIKKEKIDIYDIPITKITDQYLAFLETMSILNLDITSEFLVMAATLIYIKSRTLLYPKEPFEEEELEEQKKELVERLLEYQRYKEVTEKLLDFAQDRSKVFSRPSYPDQTESPGNDLSDIEVGIFDLVLALRNVLHKVGTEEAFVPIEINEIDIKDRIRQIMTFLRLHQETHFEGLLEGKYEKQNIVVTFLALLEMVKTGVIRIRQAVPFGKLYIFAININQ